MSINFLKLKNDKNNRNIRAVIMNGSHHINVYEPTPQDIDVILEAQEQWVSLESGVNVEPSDLVRKLFPMLTDIEGIDELSDDEINDILDNPTIALLSVKLEIESILSEVYRLIAVRARKMLQDSDFEMEAMLINKESQDRTLSLAMKYGDTPELANKIKALNDELTALSQENELTKEDIQAIVAKHSEVNNVTALDDYKKAVKKDVDEKAENNLNKIDELKSQKIDSLLEVIDKSENVEDTEDDSETETLGQASHFNKATTLTQESLRNQNIKEKMDIINNRRQMFAEEKKKGNVTGYNKQNMEDN